MDVVPEAISEPRPPHRALVKLGATESSCWEWIGTKTRNGYGKKQFAARTWLAHRWLWSMILGPIPEGMVIDHTCSNPGCVNPRHLRVTTQAENVRAGVSTVLTEGDVAEVREMLSDGFTHAEIGAKFGVSRATIKSIAAGESWGAPEKFYGAKKNEHASLSKRTHW